MTGPNQIYCVLDFETYSEADLKLVGAFEYSAHPTTEILCAAFRIGTRSELRSAPTYMWSPRILEHDFGKFYAALINPEIKLIAHNSFFEQCIVKNVFAVKYMYSKIKELRSIPIDRWICTASMAAALALPRNLEGAALALKLPVQKDIEGKKLMLKWCRPRTPTANNPKLRHDDPAELKRLMEYCAVDVGTEIELFLKAEELIPLERKVWELDQAINFRGCKIDRPLVQTTLQMVSEEQSRMNDRVQEITLGVLNSANQRAAVLDWVNENGAFLPDLKRSTVEDALKNSLVQGDTKELLEIRLATSKTSTAKYEAFEQRSRSDGRLRDTFMYHGASTGRWSGTGVQLHNLPRGTIKDTTQAAEILAQGDIETVRMLYGNPMDVFSSCLRGMIIPSDGMVLDVADYAAIETRVLFWVAKHEDGLQAFKDGRDLYKEMGGKIYGKPVDKIAKDSVERILGKIAILGLGYQMGGPKFAVSCRAQGIKIEDDFAQDAVATYRSLHWPVPKLWELIGKAAIAATENPAKKYAVNYTSWYMRKGFLCCELPSGRRLSYYSPSVDYELTPWGDRRPVLSHWGVDPLSKKWVKQKTYGGRLVENVVQAIARDIMADAMLRIEKTGMYKIILSVHDELVVEKPAAYNHFMASICELMETPPAWGIGIPIAVEGWTGNRYRK